MRKEEDRFVNDLKILDRKETSEEKMNAFLSNLSCMINYYGLHTKELVSEIRKDNHASDLFASISGQWIVMVGSLYAKDWTYDERNRFSYQICNQLLFDSSIGKQFFKPYRKIKLIDWKTAYPDYSLAECVSLYMCREHRTLQQTFTGLVFSFLTETSEDFRTMTKEIGREGLGMLPMI